MPPLVYKAPSQARRLAKALNTYLYSDDPSKKAVNTCGADGGVVVTGRTARPCGAEKLRAAEVEVYRVVI